MDPWEQVDRLLSDLEGYTQAIRMEWANVKEIPDVQSTLLLNGEPPNQDRHRGWGDDLGGTWNHGVEPEDEQLVVIRETIEWICRRVIYIKNEVIVKWETVQMYMQLHGLDPHSRAREAQTIN